MAMEDERLGDWGLPPNCMPSRPFPADLSVPSLRESLSTQDLNWPMMHPLVPRVETYE